MRRTNTFTVVPRSDADEELLGRMLDASASLWNELTYERRQQFFEGESVWNTTDYRKQYVGVLGSATAQQVIRKSDEAWKSFFALLEDPDADANLPGYWGLGNRRFLVCERDAARLVNADHLWSSHLRHTGRAIGRGTFDSWRRRNVSDAERSA
ncbi:MAG: transposase [Halobacteriales archaeon]|jgi:transposase